MAQSRKMSMVETVINSVGGLIIALLCQVTIFRWLNISVSASQNGVIVAVMMTQSLIRQYIFRRFFNWLEDKFGA